MNRRKDVTGIYELRAVTMHIPRSPAITICVPDFAPKCVNYGDLAIIVPSDVGGKRARGREHIFVGLFLIIGFYLGSFGLSLWMRAYFV